MTGTLKITATDLGELTKLSCCVELTDVSRHDKMYILKAVSHALEIRDEEIPLMLIAMATMEADNED